MRSGFTALLASKPGSETATGQNRVVGTTVGEVLQRAIRFLKAFSGDRRLLECPAEWVGKEVRHHHFLLLTRWFIEFIPGVRCAKLVLGAIGRV